MSSRPHDARITRRCPRHCSANCTLQPLQIQFGYQLSTWPAQGLAISGKVQQSLSEMMHLAYLPSRSVLAGQLRCCIIYCCTIQRNTSLHVGNVFTKVTQQKSTEWFVLEPAAYQDDDVWQGYSWCLAEGSTFPAWAMAAGLGVQSPVPAGAGQCGRGCQPLGAVALSPPAPGKRSPPVPRPLSPHCRTDFPSVIFSQFFGGNCSISARKKEIWKGSFRQIKALVTSEREQAGSHPPTLFSLLELAAAVAKLTNVSGGS